MEGVGARLPVGPQILFGRRMHPAGGGAARMEWHFHKEMPRLSEFPRQNSRRYAAVRADVHQKIFHPRKIFCLNEIFGLVGLNNPVAHEFEPMIAFAFKITQLLLQRFLFRHQRVLALQVLAEFQCLCEIGICKTLETRCYGGNIIFEILNEKARRMEGFRLLAFQASQILVPPFVRQRNFLTHCLHLFRQFFFPQKASLRTLLSAALECAMVVVIYPTTPLNFSFRRNRVAALAAGCKTEKLKILRSSLFAGFPVGDKCFLYLVKKFLCNHWLVRSGMHLASIPEMSVIEGIIKYVRNRSEGEGLAGLANQADRKHFALNTSERKLSRSKSP